MGNVCLLILKLGFQNHSLNILLVNFVNGILALLRDNANKTHMHHTQDYFKDIQWFLQFLPRFNGVVFINKGYLEHNETLCIYASLTGIVGVRRDRVYASPFLDFPGFDLKSFILRWLMLNNEVVDALLRLYSEHQLAPALIRETASSYIWG